MFDATGVTSVTEIGVSAGIVTSRNFGSGGAVVPGDGAAPETPIVSRWRAPLAVARFRAAPEQVPRPAVGLTPRPAGQWLRRVPYRRRPIAEAGLRTGGRRADVSIRLRIDLVMMLPPRIASRVACPPEGSVAHFTGERARAHVQSQGPRRTRSRWQRFRLTLAG